MNIAAIVILGGLFSGILFLTAVSWLYTFAAMSTGRPLPLSAKPEDRPPTERGLIDILINMLIYALFSWAVIMLLLSLGLIERSPSTDATPQARPIQFFAMGSVQLFAVALGTLFVCLRARIGPGRFGWDLRQWPEDIVLAFYAFGLVIVPVFVVQGLLSQIIEYEHPAMTPFKTNKSWAFFAGAFFSAVISAPIAEEYFFRGLLQAWLQRLGLYGAKTFGELLAPNSPPPPPPLDVRMPTAIDVGAFANPYTYAPTSPPFEPLAANAVAATDAPSRLTPQWPIWVTSAIFALLHMGQGAAPVPLFFFSVMLGYVYRKTGRLFPVIVMHLMLNGISMTALAASTFAKP